MADDQYLPEPGLPALPVASAGKREDLDPRNSMLMETGACSPGKSVRGNGKGRALTVGCMRR